MLTAKQAREIILESVRDVTGVVGMFLSDERIAMLGIHDALRIQMFKSAIVNHAGLRGYRIEFGAVDFDGNSTVGEIQDLIVSLAIESVKPGGAPSDYGRAVHELARKTGKKKPIAPRRKPRSADRSAVGMWRTQSGGGKRSGARSVPTKAKKKTTARKKGKTVKSFQPGDGGRRSVAVDVRGRKDSERVLAGKPESSAELPGENLDRLAGDVVSWEDRGGAPTSSGASNQARSPSKGESGPSLDSHTRVVECTPQLETRKVLLAAKAYRLAVFLDQGPVAPGADVQKAKVEVSIETEFFELDVWLDCSSHFALDGMPDRARITVSTQSGVSDELEFTLRVLHFGDDRPMYVSAFFRYNGRPSGKITRYLEFVGNELRWKAFVPREQLKGEIALPNAGAPPSVEVETEATPAEIRIEVLKTQANDGQHYAMKCFTAQGNWDGPWNLPQVTKDLVNTYMQTFMTSNGDARVASLEGAGMAFWDALPKEARLLLWDALEKGAQTMSVVSEEPYIPWELVVPYQRVQNPRKPLGVEVQLGRWISGDYKSARQRIPMKSGYVVCPKTSGLQSAALESAFLTEQLKPNFAPVDEVTPASFTGVDKGLSGPQRDVIHFICHGKTAALQTLELDKPDILDCSMVRTLKGFQNAFKNGPLAFLNACEVGGQVLALDGVGGFAHSFIELGASAVIAPLWPVQDSAALNVTKTFYTQALKGARFAEVMKQIRAKGYEEAIDSYVAYCFYGDPLASTRVE